jgi:voltage-gated potassium channel
MVANTMIHTAITQPTMYKAIHAILTGKSVARIDEIRVYECESIIGKSIDDLAFKKAKLLFMGIQRQGEFIFNPLHTEIIQGSDILLVMGREISLDYFKSLYEKGVS